MQREDEPDLIARMKDGDEVAFHVLVERYHDLLFRTLVTKVSDREVARDLTQDTFVRIWLKRHILRPKQPFFAILAKIGTNKAQDELRRNRVRERYRDHVARLSERPSENPDQSVQRTQLETRILEVIARFMPERCRLVFVLSRLEGLSNDQVAEVLGISKKTVENQRLKAGKILRKHCAEYLS